jgi:hypothetical protein
VKTEQNAPLSRGRAGHEFDSVPNDATGPARHQVSRRLTEAELDPLRARLSDYLERTGTELTKRGTRYLGLCPGHEDSSPSLAVYGSRLSVCGCYPCGFSGDVFALAKWLGRACSFRDAVQHVADVLGQRMPEGELVERYIRPLPKVKAPEPVKFDPEMNQRARIEWDNRYFGEDPVAFIAMKNLGLPPEAFRLCSHGKSGLGWAKGSICYAYPSGLKWRNPNAGAKPRFVWLTGKATAPWRADWIKPETRTCYITEGESDCIALVAAGLEDDGITVCTAIPGADGFAPKWAQLYRGKRVVMCFDDDPAGRTAVATVAAALRGYAAEILRWKGPNADE